MPARDHAIAATAALDAWNMAFNRADAAAVARLYAAEARFLPATHQVIEGPAAVEAFFTPMLAQGVTGHTNELVTSGDDGSLVYCGSRWTVRVPKEGGATETASGFATHVFRRDADGSLKILLHTFN